MLYEESPQTSIECAQRPAKTSKEQIPIFFLQVGHVSHKRWLNVLDCFSLLVDLVDELFLTTKLTSTHALEHGCMAELLE